jgi:hypothetical protein
MTRPGEPDERATLLVRLVSLLLAVAGFSTALLIAGHTAG